MQLKNRLCDLLLLLKIKIKIKKIVRLITRVIIPYLVLRGLCAMLYEHCTVLPLVCVELPICVVTVITLLQ